MLGFQVALMSASRVVLLEALWRSERSVASGETRVIPLGVSPGLYAPASR
jgi:hypothetical protein